MIKIKSLPRKILRSKKLRLWLGVGAAVALAVFFLLRSINSPAVGTVINAPVVAPTITDSSNYNNLDSTYFSMLYPNQYYPQLGKPKSSSQIGYNLFSTNGDSPNSSTIEIYIIPTPTGGIVPTAEYQYYLSRQDTYKLSTKFYRGETVIIATRTRGGNERIAMWEHKRYVLVVKLASPDKKQDIDVQLQTIMNSVQWRQA